MSIKTRKHMRTVSLVMSIAIVGMLAAFLVLAANPGPTQAQDDQCDTATGDALALLRDLGFCPAGTSDPAQDDQCDTATGDALALLQDLGFCPTGGTDARNMITPSSTTGSAAVKLTLTIVLEQDLTGSSWVEIYLENDYQEPGSIARENVIFEVQGINPAETDPPSNPTLNTTFSAAAVEIDDGGKIDGEEDAVVISARIPDMRSGDEIGYALAGQTLIMVVSDAAGIQNPSEAGSHSVGYSIIGGTDDRADEAGMKLTDLKTEAKISLNADDGGRSKEITIAGSGFNDGTTAEVKVLVAAVGLNEDDDMTNDITCAMVMEDGDSLGTVNVGSDDKFAIVFTVHQDEFDAGNVNYICAEDTEAGNPRQASAVKLFELTASISLDPAEANSGDEVTLKARDFGGELTEISLGPDKTWTEDATDTDAFSVKKDDDDYTFDVPGGLSGVIQVAAKRGSTRKTADLTITPSSLTLNQTEVAPNQSIIISGSGFSEDSYVLVEKITIDGEPLVVDESGVEGVTSKEATDANMPADDGKDAVKTTSSGQFTVTVNIWHDGAGNPALDADEYTIKVTDSNGYEGKTKITILEPTVMVTPLVAGPRDTITIRGTNWPVTTSDDDHDVDISIDGKTRSVSIDSIGRFNYSYQLSGGIDIGTEHDITVMFDGGVGGDIEETITFSVPSANVVITPLAAAPGESIDLEITGMPIYERVTEVTIDGGNRMGGTAINTDSEGDVTITGIVIPFADPGFYPVKIVVGTGGSAETAIVQLEILAESDVRGVTSPLPGAVMDLGDSVVRIFHFNTSSKVWTFYDPRPEFEDLNTLTELAAGQPYWILVSENVENVVLNGRTRNLTCVGGDCWNQLVW